MYLQLGLVLLLNIALPISGGKTITSEEAVGATIPPDLIEEERARLKREIANYTNDFDVALMKNVEKYIDSPDVRTLQQIANAHETITTLTQEAQRTMLRRFKNGDASRYAGCESIVMHITQQLSKTSDVIFKCSSTVTNMRDLKYNMDAGIQELQSYLVEGRKFGRRSPEDDFIDFKILRKKQNKAWAQYVETSWLMEHSVYVSLQNLKRSCNLETQVRDYKTFIATKVSEFERCSEISNTPDDSDIATSEPFIFLSA